MGGHGAIAGSRLLQFLLSLICNLRERERGEREREREGGGEVRRILVGWWWYN